MSEPRDMLTHISWVVGIAVVLFVWYRLGQRYYGWRLRRWARSNDLVLIEFRGAHAGELRNSSRQAAFYVEVEDRRGRRRHAYVVFGRWIGFDFWSVTTSVWDD